MELAGEKVFMAPALQEMRIDANRKTPPTSTSNARITDPLASRPSAEVARGDVHDHTYVEGQAGAGRLSAKNVHVRRHTSRQGEPRSGHEEKRRRKSRKHDQEVAQLTAASSEAGSQAILNSGDGTLNFTDDRTGDQYNVTYGSVHRYSIPRYRIAGLRRVLGLGRNQRILQGSEGNARVLSEDHMDSGVRLKAQSLLVPTIDRTKAAVPVVPEIPNTQDTVAELQRDFLPLSPYGRRKRRRLEAEEPFHARLHYRPQLPEQSAEPQSPPRRRACSDSGTNSSDADPSAESSPDDSFEQFRKDARQQKTVELSRAVHDHPHDIGAWLALIRHQDGVLETSEGTTREPTYAEKYGPADVKVSIYETALSKNSEHPERDRLIVGMMEEGSKIWDSKKLANQWRLVLKENAQFPNLWIKYLDFEQSNFLTFTYDQCKSLYTQCLRITGIQPLHSNRDQLRIYILLRLTAFMRDAGYSEYAVGLWQAVLEYNYFRPTLLKGQIEESSFEDFWNSEVARVGEDGARGWKSGSSPEVAPSSDTSNLVVDPANVLQSWPECEQERVQIASLPARTLDEVNDDDPYRVILSSDVSEYLFSVTEPENKAFLLDGFLLFCHLPPLPVQGMSFEQQWWTDSFLQSSDLNLVHTLTHPIPHHSISTVSPILSFVNDTSTMFAGSEHWFSCWQYLRNSSSSPRMQGFRHLALRQLVDALPNDDRLAEYLIAYQLELDAKEARKLAKALLKQRPASLRLYNAYAVVEGRLGNVEAAERARSTALSMSRSFPGYDRMDALLLWRTWIWDVLDRGESRKAFALLLAVPEGQVDVDKLPEQSQPLDQNVHSTAILKARRTFESILAQATSLQQADLVVHYADFLALLAYFTSADSLTAALAAYSILLEPSTAMSSSNVITMPPATVTERLHQSRARLLHHHIRTSSGFRPAQMTQALGASLALFPANTIFQSLYHYHTRDALLLDRIRTVIPTRHSTSQSSLAKDSIVPAIFDIYSAITRPAYAGSTDPAIRAAFERALATDVGQSRAHCPTLWTWYLRWELSTSANMDAAAGGPDMARLSTAQDIFYRGIRACPWAKAFYMLAFTEPRLRDAIGVAGLRRIYETMVEKGLRIHVDLAEAGGRS